MSVKQQQRTLDDLPPFPPLVGEMEAGLMVNERNIVWLVHDRPLRDYLHWVEFDSDRMVLTLVYRGGRVQDYGRPVHPELADILRRTRQILTMQLKGEEIVDSYMLPLLVRDIQHEGLRRSAS